jgi:hypothetical protein
MNMRSADLFGWTPPNDAGSAPLREAFERFHAQHPEVYVLFDRYAKQAIARGYKRFSSDAILHRIRWQAAIEAKVKPYKINNDYTPYYARLWMKQNPGWEDFFELRVAEGEGA